VTVPIILIILLRNVMGTTDRNCPR